MKIVSGPVPYYFLKFFSRNNFATCVGRRNKSEISKKTPYLLRLKIRSLIKCSFLSYEYDASVVNIYRFGLLAIIYLVMLLCLLYLKGTNCEHYSNVQSDNPVQ